MHFSRSSFTLLFSPQICEDLHKGDASDGGPGKFKEDLSSPLVSHEGGKLDASASEDVSDGVGGGVPGLPKELSDSSEATVDVVSPKSFNTVCELGTVYFSFSFVFSEPSDLFLPIFMRVTFT